MSNGIIRGNAKYGARNFLNDTNEGTIVKYRGYIIESAPTYQEKGRKFIWHIGKEGSESRDDSAETVYQAKNLIDHWVDVRDKGLK